MLLTIVLLLTSGGRKEVTKVKFYMMFYESCACGAISLVIGWLMAFSLSLNEESACLVDDNVGTNHQYRRHFCQSM
jgi:predicted Na+-dependent transporter